MARITQIFSGFAYGEVDPKLYARPDLEAYTRGCKTATNVLSIPQGGFTNCFGTKYVSTLATVSSTVNYTQYDGEVLVLDLDTKYVLIFSPLLITIYLEGVSVATVVTTYAAADISSLNYQQLQDVMVITNRTSNYAPRRLVRSGAAANTINSVDAVNNYLVLNTPVTANLVFAASFNVGTALPSTFPQISTNVIYYLYSFSTTEVAIYSTAYDAVNDLNRYTITNVGTGVNTVTIYNTWTLVALNSGVAGEVNFSNYPTYDFDKYATYSAAAFTFTPSALAGTIGSLVTLTASAAVFTSAHVGGIYEGDGGVLRITNFTNSTQVEGYTEVPFIGTGSPAAPFAIPGRLSDLREPAWSDTRGWPRCSAYFQGRQYFAGSRQIPNGVWGSAVETPWDFDDGLSNDDSAISNYPSANRDNLIKFMTATKSLLTHSSSGNYSSPLTATVALTPISFFLTEQNRFGASNIQPVFSDDQIIFVDGVNKNVRAMQWDFDQSSYTDGNASIFSAHLITDPIDLAVFQDPLHTDGFYILVPNIDGSMAIYNTLYEQNIRAWTKRTTEQNDSSTGYFRRVFSNKDRCWAIVERTIQGVNKLMLEELTYRGSTSDDTMLFTDSSVIFKDNASATITGLSHLNGQNVDVYADGGYTFTNIAVSGGSITLNESVDNGYVGLRKVATFEPLPVNANLQTGPTLYEDNKIRTMHIHYFETVGAKIQGSNIPVVNLVDVSLTTAISPQTGVYEFSPMQGYQGFIYDITITQELPLPFTLLAYGYSVET